MELWHRSFFQENPLKPHTFIDLRIGTDLVYTPRLRRSYARLGVRFVQRLLTPGELAYCQGDGVFRESFFLKRVAARIAVKEAVAKALGSGLNGLGWGQGIDWQDVEVVAHKQSPPELVLSGRALQCARQLNIECWRFSLSHDGDYAIATVTGLIKA